MSSASCGFTRIGLILSAVLARAAWAEQPPPGADPEAPVAPPAQHRDANPRPASPLVYRTRIRPHWFANNTRFWYRNDLPGGAREFVLVNAEEGTRERAFDHELAAREIGTNRDGLHLPVEELSFSNDSNALILVGGEKSWRLDRATGKLEECPTPEPSAEGRSLSPQPRTHRSARSGPESEILFENRLGEVVEVFWIDEEGHRHSYGKVGGRSRKRQHTFGGHVWLVATERGETLAVFEAADLPARAIVSSDSAQPSARERAAPPRREEGDRSPDGQWTASVRDNNVHVRSREGEEIQVSSDGEPGDSYGDLTWSPDSKFLVAWRTEPGEHKDVFLIRSSPENGGRAQLESRPYALPGDKFPRSELNVFAMGSRRQTKPAVDRFEHEWLRPQVHWNRAGTRFAYSQEDRGHQRFRVIQVDPSSGEVRNVIDEKSATFIWTAHTESLGLELVNWLEQSDELIYVSERDGWRHLYLADLGEGRITTQITRGEWVVRGIERIDPSARQVWFSASGRNPDQDPYFVHHYRVNFDGTGLVALTEANGNHSVEFSPDRKFLIDTWSRIDAPPVNELRRCADGAFVCKLEDADAHELEASGWVAPEPFAAVGRDGKTEIYGIIQRPQRFDPQKKYPVVEYIYAGPQGSYVPKSFSASDHFKFLTERGFVVVQIDGMGTANRSKAFHDVCYKNLKDGGLQDHILWLKAAAATRSYLDLSRVGIYGNSAGGQNAAAAVLFHPEFYKAAVASCGCHDNRLDKASWNEQWMGYMAADRIWRKSPDNWFSQSSNIDNADRLTGHLFLIVGGMDDNVPPESTLRFADALIRAGKDFELLVIPNGRHGFGGAYGERRMGDFFVRHLLGTEPPNRNSPLRADEGEP